MNVLLVLLLLGQGANTEEAKKRGDSVTVVEKGEIARVNGVVTPRIEPEQPMHKRVGLGILLLNTILLLWVLVLKLMCGCKKEGQ